MRLTVKICAWLLVAWFGMQQLDPGLALATAGELSTRSSTLSTSAGGASGVTATFNVTPGSTTTVEAVRFQICTSPIPTVLCTAPTGASMGSSTAGTQLKNGSSAGFNQYGSPSYTGSTDVVFSNVTGNGFNGSSDTFTFPVNSITLPTAVNSEFYFRMTTYSNVGATAQVDFGVIAESTSAVLAETANVEEDLTFCVGATGTNCSNIAGSSLTLAPSPMGSGAPSTGNAVMEASTNAAGGYVITYNATSFTDSTGDTICTGSCVTNMQSGQALNAGGTEQFGFNLVANSGGNFGVFGSAPSGGSGTVTSPYGSTNQIAYSTVGAVQVASALGTSTPTLYTMSYGANVAGITKPGTYVATQTFIATATF